MRGRAAHLLGLWAVSVAQPLFDLLGRNPEFFAAHGAGRVEIVAFGLALVLVPPALLLAVELAARAISDTGAAGLHLAFVAMTRVAVRKDAGDELSLSLAEAVRRRRAALARQVALFGSRTPPPELFAVGPQRDLLGRGPPPGVRALIEFAQRVAPRLLALGGRASPGAIAVVSGGATVAVAPVYDGRFWVLAPTARDDVRVVEIR